MPDSNQRQLYLAQSLALECKQLLVEAITQHHSNVNWFLLDEIGQTYHASMNLEQGLDAPVLEVTDLKTHALLFRFKIQIECEPIEEKDD
jgi:hypothetical protein